MIFYKVRYDEGRRKKFTEAIPVFGYPTEKRECEVCNRTWHSFRKMYDENLPYPISFIRDNFVDFISCEAFILVSENAKCIMEKFGINTPLYSKMTGVAKSELTAEKIKDLRDRGRNVSRLTEVTPTYYSLSAEIGAQMHEDLNYKWVDTGNGVCKHCGRGVGYEPDDCFAPDCISLKSWNGSDFFRAKETGRCLFCTENFKKFYKEQNFKGLRFEEIEGR